MKVACPVLESIVLTRVPPLVNKANETDERYVVADAVTEPLSVPHVV